MVQFRFTSEFRRWAKVARKHCVLCKAMSLIVHPPGSVAEIDVETAIAATEAGAGEVIAYLPDQDSP